MAMTKSERERVAALENEVRLARALRWPTYTPTLIPPPNPNDRGGLMTRGFLWSAYHCRDRFVAGCVEHAASSSIYHIRSDDIETVDKFVNPPKNVRYHGGGSQGARTLAATRRDALMMVRIELTRQWAQTLADIDAAIDAEGAVVGEVGNG